MAAVAFGSYQWIIAQVVEGLPVADNRVQLADRDDPFGVPLARVTHTTRPASAALWKASLAEGREIFEAADAREVWRLALLPGHLPQP